MTNELALSSVGHTVSHDYKEGSALPRPGSAAITIVALSVLLAGCATTSTVSQPASPAASTPSVVATPSTAASTAAATAPAGAGAQTPLPFADFAIPLKLASWTVSQGVEITQCATLNVSSLYPQGSAPVAVNAGGLPPFTVGGGRCEISPDANGDGTYGVADRLAQADNLTLTQSNGESLSWLEKNTAWATVMCIGIGTPYLETAVDPGWSAVIGCHDADGQTRHLMYVVAAKNTSLGAVTLLQCQVDSRTDHPLGPRKRDAEDACGWALLATG